MNFAITGKSLQMVSVDFEFGTAKGRQLTGVLESPRKEARAWAVFAHCFTCDKASLAAFHVSRALAGLGVGVLRFDFAGLGDSAGQFGEGLSADSQDIACAVEAMVTRGKPPALLVGHSFGGAAVLAAAANLPSVKAVAVIGTPFRAEHVFKHIEPLPVGKVEGPQEVTIAGRAFDLGEGFYEDITGQDQETKIANLRRALLVLHSPVDEVVAVENASAIFQAARHPKSFVSLDDASHLLTRKADASYAARVIAAWASRYL